MQFYITPIFAQVQKVERGFSLEISEFSIEK